MKRMKEKMGFNFNNWDVTLIREPNKLIDKLNIKGRKITSTIYWIML